MKHFVLTLIAIAISNQAGAVSVKDCPKNLDVRLTDLSVISAQKLTSEISKFEDEQGDYEKFRQSLSGLDKITVKAELDSAAKARCVYSVKQSSFGVNKFNEIVLATSKGKDWLRLRLYAPAGIIGGYITVTSYDATHGIETSGNAPLGMDDPSHPGMMSPTIAWAKSIEMK